MFGQKRYMIEDVNSKSVRYESTLEEALKAVSFFYAKLHALHIILTDNKCGRWIEYKFKENLSCDGIYKGKSLIIRKLS